jgi:hypothetical protein
VVRCQPGSARGRAVVGIVAAAGCGRQVIRGGPGGSRKQGEY